MLNRIHNKSHLLVSITLLLLAISMRESVMFWVQILVFCALAMRLAIYAELHRHLPSSRAINLLGILCAIALAYYGFSLGILISMVNLLVLASALKLMLLSKEKGYYQLVATQMFLLACGFIFAQSIAITIFYCFVLFLLLLSLASHHAPSADISKQIKFIGILTLQGLPIAVLLFLVMPKISPLWQVPTAKNAETGLSEEVTPGDIANLSQDSKLAFRATFSGEIPQRNKLYWRTLVLEEFDGKTWRVANLRKNSIRYHWRADAEFSPDYSGEYIDYEVIAEPSQQRWLYALDVASSGDEDIWMSRDYRLQRTQPLTKQYKYQVRSYPDLSMEQGLIDFDQQLNLIVPERGNPKTREWVQDLLKQYPSKPQFMGAVLNYFVKNKFQYTLKPPPMFFDSVDQFLFEHKKGFCSHYASAYAYVMRLAGIPARLVTGYQGGEKYQRYLSIYQYDAHAWVEVWEPAKGWVRIDPTAIVASDRINFGLQAAVAYEDSFLVDAPFTLARFQKIALLNQLRLLMANADYQWSRWVLGFDQKKQLDLFRNILGDLNIAKVAYLSLGAMLIIGALLVAFNYRIWFPKISDLGVFYYMQALAVIEKKGLSRNTNLGAEEFSHLVASKFPESFARDFAAVNQLFIKYQYQQQSNETLKRLKDAVKMFKKKYG